MKNSGQSNNPRIRADRMLRAGIRSEGNRIINQGLYTAGFHPVLAVVLGAVFAGLLNEAVKAI